MQAAFSQITYAARRPVRKALPLLLRYLVVVAASCLLALVISSSHAHAAAATDRSAPGPYAIAVSESVWRDEARMRDIPVRVVAPVLPATKQGKPAGLMPVILFSHGLGGNREGGSVWADHWASYGYLVVQMQHAGSDEALWKGKTPAEIPAAMKAGMTAQNLVSRVQDVHFAIDQVVKKAQAKDGPFATADTARIGMSGHSFGAQTTLVVSGQASGSARGVSGLDKRIVAAIAFSPNARTKSNLETQFGGIALPFFSVTGTKDGAILGDGTVYTDRQLPYQNMPKGDKYLVTFQDGDHMVFGGHTMRGPRSVTRDSEIRAAVKAATLAFWDSTLRNDLAARDWLRENFKGTLQTGDAFEWK